MTGFKSKREAVRSGEMTDWFPVTIFPVREGVYEVCMNDNPVQFAKWDSKKWCVPSYIVSVAEYKTDRSWAMYLLTDARWRGFTHEQ
jgi:hypothetical protein